MASGLESLNINGDAGIIPIAITIAHGFIREGIRRVITEQHHVTAERMNISHLQ